MKARLDSSYQNCVASVGLVLNNLCMSHDNVFDEDNIIMSIDVRRAISKLPDEQKKVIVLYYVEGLSKREVAQEMSLPSEREVCKQLQLAKEKIAMDIFEEEG